MRPEDTEPPVPMNMAATEAAIERVPHTNVQRLAEGPVGTEMEKVRLRIGIMSGSVSV